MSDFDEGSELGEGSGFDAESDFDGAPEGGSESDAALDQELEQAVGMGDEGDWSGMAEYLRETLERYPGDPAVLCWLGVAERELGMEGIAYERFRACVAAEPSDPHLLAIAGTGLAHFDDPAAESTLRTAALTGEDMPFVRTMYGAYLSREGMIDDALREITAALALAPDDPEALTECGVAMALGERYDEAVEAFSKAWAADPEDGWARSLAGLVLVSLGRTEDALADLIGAADLRPEDVELALLAGLASAASGEEERARLRAIPGDLPLVEEVSDRVEDGYEVAKTFLEEDFVTGALRERLMTRP